MKVSAENGWVMLGLVNYGAELPAETGEEFADTCISDPSQCTDGLTLALWLHLGNLLHIVKHILTNRLQLY